MTYKNREIWTQTHRERQHEDRGRHYRDATASPGCLQPPEAGRGKKDPSLKPQCGRQPCNTLISDIWSQKWEGVSLYGFKLPGLWYFGGVAQDTHPYNPLESSALSAHQRDGCLVWAQWPHQHTTADRFPAVQSGGAGPSKNLWDSPWTPKPPSLPRSLVSGYLDFHTETL